MRSSSRPFTRHTAPCSPAPIPSSRAISSDLPALLRGAERDPEGCRRAARPTGARARWRGRWDRAGASPPGRASARRAARSESHPESQGRSGGPVAALSTDARSQTILSGLQRTPQRCISASCLSQRSVQACPWCLFKPLPGAIPAETFGPCLHFVCARLHIIVHGQRGLAPTNTDK